MACGHHIVSNICNPKDTHKQTCKDQRQRFIYDTCAGCDPEYKRSVLEQHHDQRHSRFMDLYLQAKKEGDTEGMEILEQLMIMAAQDLRRENFKLSLTRGLGPVIWPETEG